MSIKLNDKQLVLLSAASQRDDHCLVPPAGPKRAQGRRALARLLEAGLVKGIRAKAGAPIWRRDDDTGQTYALKLTAAGAKAIAVDETGSFEGEAERRPDHPIVSVDRKPEPCSDSAAAIDKRNSYVASPPTSPRGGTKIAQVIELLQRGDGATLAELVAATGWLPHTMRAALTGLRKRGYAVGMDRADKARGSVYRIEPRSWANMAPHSTLRRRRGSVRPNARGCRPSNPFRYFNSSPEVIRLVVMMYVRLQGDLTAASSTRSMKSFASAARLRSSSLLTSRGAAWV